MRDDVLTDDQFIVRERREETQFPHSNKFPLRVSFFNFLGGVRT
jgi:hypothetical protein